MAIAEAALRDLTDDTGVSDSPAQSAERDAQIHRLFREARPQGGSITFEPRGGAPVAAAVPAQDDALGGAIAALSTPVAAPAKATAPKMPAAAAEPPQPKTLPPPNDLSYGTQAKEAAKFIGSMVAAPGAAIAGGIEGIWELGSKLAGGASLDEATAAAKKTVEARQHAVAFEPVTEQGRKVQGAMASPWNPLNWFPMAVKKGAELEQEAVLKAAEKVEPYSPQLANTLREVSAGVAALKEGVGNVAPILPLTRTQAARAPVTLGQTAEARQAAPAPTLGAVAAGTPPPAVALPTAPVRAPAGLNERVSSTPPAPLDLGLEVPKTGTPRALVESEPVKGGVPAAAQQERASILQRLGIRQAWRASVRGDAHEGAVNAQIAKFTEQPAGKAAAEQFAHETQALQAATSGIAEKVGGTLGRGEDANFARGSKIAAVGDKLRQWFDKTETALYKAADEKTKGLPVVSVEPVEALLKDRTFKNAVMARDKGHLLAAVEDQLALFKETNPQGLTVKNAEQFRQWLNEQWTPENSAIIGKVKGAVDKAVTAAAGEDVYAASRATHMAKKQTLENTKGISRIWDADPRNAVNRATAIEKIPQTVERMSVEQFKELVGTLRKKMPKELAADAAAAEAEMKAHFVQGILDAGTPATKTPSPFWNNRRVNDYIAANREKMNALFSKEELARIADIRAGGNIIAVDTSYPGAAAQASIAAKQGLMSRIIGPAATSAGGGLGTLAGAIVGMPVQGGMVGSVAGRAAGEQWSAKAAEAAALKNVNKRMQTLEEITR